MYEFQLPDLGEGIHEAEILKWYVQPGDAIEQDASLVDVETDKAAVTIPTPVGGKVVSLGGQVGDVITVGSVVVVIESSERNQAASAPAPKPQPPPVSEAATSTAAPSPAAPSPAAPPSGASAPQSSRPIPAAPATRRLARELGVDIRLVPPSGPAGRVTPDDVTAFHQAQASGSQPAPSAAAPAPAVAALATTAASPSSASPSPDRAAAQYAAHAATAVPFLDIEPLPDFSPFGPVEREPLRSIRRKVAHKMVTAKIVVPHVAHMDEADVTELEAFRRREREKRTGQPGGRLTLLAFVVKAVTAGLRASRAFNASLDPFKEELVYKQYYNIGIAADTGRGLVVPVIRDTDRKSLIEIAADIERLARQAREGTLGVEDFRGGTFTITNIGPMGGTALIPAVNYPEVAILGMGKAQEKPVVRDGEIVIRTILPLSFAFDHRVADGADAARFVSEMARQLSDPNQLLLET